MQLIEDKLKEIVNEISALDIPEIDPDEDLFSLGLDSLMLTQVKRKITEHFDVDIPSNMFLMELTTLNKISAYLSAHTPEPAAEIPSVYVNTGVASPVAFAGPVISDNGNLSAMEKIMAGQLEIMRQQIEILRDTEAAASRQVVPSSALKSKTVPPVAHEKKAETDQKAIQTPLNFKKKTDVKARGLTPQQQEYLKDFIIRFNQKTKSSKEQAGKYRNTLSDSRASVGFNLATKEMLYPIVGERAKGSRLWDVDGNEYIDVTMGFGVNLFGHHPEFVDEALSSRPADDLQLGPRSPFAGEAAQLISELTGLERVAFTNTGTEAVMAAIRLVRAATGKNKIAMFYGSYHGHSDLTLAVPKVVNGKLCSEPISPGVLPQIADQVIVLDYLDPKSLDIIKAHAHELAAVIVEPVQSRRPDVDPLSFLQELRKITKDNKVALFFDEVITGFRAHPGGAQGYFGVKADICTYGKIVGGGLPIGVIAGDPEYLDGIDGGQWQYGDLSYPPADRTFFGGTFCQHPLSMIAAHAVLRHLKKEGPELQKSLNDRTGAFVANMNRYFGKNNTGLKLINFSSLFRISYQGNTDLLFYHLLYKGIYIWEWRSCFLSTAHTDDDLARISNAFKESIEEMQQGGFSFK